MKLRSKLIMIFPLTAIAPAFAMHYDAMIEAIKTPEQRAQEATQELRESNIDNDIRIIGKFGTWETRNNDLWDQLKKYRITQKYKRLIDQGADINQPTKSGDYLLVALIKERATDLFTYLIQNNRFTPINPDVQDRRFGTTALMSLFLHSYDGSEDDYIFNTLLSLRPNLNLQDNIGKTVLHEACRDNRRPHFIMTLLRLGADPNIAADDGSTPITICALVDQSPVVIRDLLRRGANPNHIDKFSNTALLSATYSNNIPNIKLLLEYGADPLFRAGSYNSSALKLWRFYNIENQIIKKEKLP